MKEIKAIINAYNSIDFSTVKAAMATVARVEGSSYRRTGARMLVQLSTFGDSNYAIELSTGLLSKCVNLGVSFAHDVYPVFQKNMLTS